jgi:hypothetical protein
MKKRGELLLPFHVICPFCEFPTTTFTEMTWCGGCFVEWYRTRSGSVMFDTERKTPRFAFAKALGKAGGVRFGTVKEGK